MVLVLGLTASAYAVTPTTSNVFQYEQRPMQQYQNPDARVQGDTVGDPFFVGALPFSVTGGTCGFFNDYDYACPYTGSTSPDVVYAYAADGAVTGLTIDLCASIYDTKVYVYDNAVGVPIACNDDYCSWQSLLANVPVTAGHTYYIVVDGYGGSCGTYNLLVEGYTPCDVVCPAGAMPEGEPTCYDGYNDTYNGGCNVVPFPIFQVIEPSHDPIVICGETGVYIFGSFLYRDTDWFELNLTADSNICLAGDSEIPTYFFIIDGRFGCSGLVIVANAIAGACAPISGLCWFCQTGTWWMWAGPSAWDTTWLCGSDYWMEITGYGGDVSPADNTTWGTIKNLFN
jgi:hypothetical protein